MGSNYGDGPAGQNNLVECEEVDEYYQPIDGNQEDHLSGMDVENKIAGVVKQLGTQLGYDESSLDNAISVGSTAIQGAKGITKKIGGTNLLLGVGALSLVSGLTLLAVSKSKVKSRGDTDVGVNP